MKIFALSLMILVMLSLASAADPVVMPYNCAGFGQNEFDVGDDICVYGTGFSEGQEYDIHIVEDQGAYNAGDSPTIVATKTVQTSGFVLGLTKLWTAVKAGFYDLFVDSDQDSQYSEGDSVNIGEGPGVTVRGDDTEDPPQPEVPEFSTVTALLALIGAGIIIRRKSG